MCLTFRGFLAQILRQIKIWSGLESLILMCRYLTWPCSLSSSSTLHSHLDYTTSTILRRLRNNRNRLNFWMRMQRRRNQRSIKWSFSFYFSKLTYSLWSSCSFQELSKLISSMWSFWLFLLFTLCSLRQLDRTSSMCSSFTSRWWAASIFTLSFTRSWPITGQTSIVSWSLVAWMLQSLTPTKPSIDTMSLI